MTARRRPSEPPPLEIREFTPEEIQRGVAKFKRRIEEVKALAADKLSFDDQRIKNVEHAIRDTILEVFGGNSPEYRAHQYHDIMHGTSYVAMPDYEIQECFEAGIPQTVTMLEGLIQRLEEKLADIGGDITSRTRTAFAGLGLHPRIAAVCVDLYRDKHYRNAVLDAAVALTNLVKEKSRRHELDGVSLMSTVFSKNSPVLAFNERKDKTEEDEQEGMMHLFMGVALALRNPRAHALDPDSAEEALECLAFLSFLAKKVDQARRTSP